MIDYLKICENCLVRSCCIDPCYEFRNNIAKTSIEDILFYMRNTEIKVKNKLYERLGVKTSCKTYDQIAGDIYRATGLKKEDDLDVKIYRINKYIQNKTIDKKLVRELFDKKLITKEESEDDEIMKSLKTIKMFNLKKKPEIITYDNKDDSL